MKAPDFEKYENLLHEYERKFTEDINNISEKRWEQSTKEYAKMTNSLLEKKIIWLRFLISTISVVFGILVSLGSKNIHHIQSRLFYALGAILLSLSILTLAISVFGELYYLGKARDLFLEESYKALLEKRKPKLVSAPTKRVFEICELSGYICSALALISLCIYMFLQVLFP